MALLFVSHSSHDRDAAEQLAKRLGVEGFAALFLDFDPADGIPAGRNWKRELFAQLRKADGVIFMASAASVASQWCITEVGLAPNCNRRGEGSGSSQSGAGQSWALSQSRVARIAMCVA